MGFYEFFARVMNEANEMLFQTICVALITILFGVLGTLFNKNIWVNSPQFKMMGIFFSIDFKQKIRISCAWLKFCFLFVYLLTFRKLSLIHYVVFAILGILTSITPRGILRWLSNLFGFIVEVFGLFAINTICGYIRDMVGGLIYIIIYVVGSILLFVYGLYLLLSELQDISEERRPILDEE